MKTLLLVAFLVLQGCATMVYGNKQEIQFTSQPPGREIEFNEQKCRTPCSLSVPRGQVPIKLKVDGEYIGEVTSAQSQEGGLVTLAVIDALLIVPSMVDAANDMTVAWPKVVHVEKGKMEVTR